MLALGSQEDEENFDTSPQDTEPAEPAESTAFLQRPKTRWGAMHRG